MASLENQKIKDTYQGIVKTNDNQELPATGQVPLTDGNGNESAISIGRAGEGITVTGGISGATFELGAKTFSINSVTPPATISDPFTFNFNITGETPEVVEIQIFLGYNDVPEQAQLLYSPVSGQDYDFWQTHTFITGSYEIHCKALYADNTYVTAVSYANVIDDRPLELTFQNISLVYYETDTTGSVVKERYQDWYDEIATEGNAYTQKYVAGTYFELTIDTVPSPYDWISDSVNYNDLTGSIFQTYINVFNASVNTIGSYPLGNIKLFTRLTNGAIRWYIPINNDINNWNELNSEQQGFRFQIRGTPPNWVIDTNRNQLSNSQATSLYEPITNIPHSFVTPNVFSSLYANVAFSSTSFYVRFAGSYQNLDFGSGITVNTYDNNNVLIDTRIANASYALQSNSIFGPVTKNVNYSIEYVGQYYDGTTFNVTETISTTEATASITSATWDNGVLTILGTVYNITARLYINNVGLGDILYRVYDSLSNPVSVLSYVQLSKTNLSWTSNEAYVEDLTSQDLNIEYTLGTSLSPGIYTVQLEGKDAWDTINLSSSRILATTTFTVT